MIVASKEKRLNIMITIKLGYRLVRKKTMNFSRRNEDEIRKAESSENSKDANLVKIVDSGNPSPYSWGIRVQRPSRSQSNLRRIKSKALLDMLISYMGNNSQNNSIDWLNLDFKRLGSDQRFACIFT